MSSQDIVLIHEDRANVSAAMLLAVAGGEYSSLECLVIQFNIHVKPRGTKAK